MTLAGCGDRNADSVRADAGTTTAQATTALDKVDAEETKDTETTGAAAVIDPTEKTTILVATATSLEYFYEDELIPISGAANPGIEVEGTFNSSNRLQTQIGEDLETNVFISAAMKQMNTLREENMVGADSIVELLESETILTTSAGSDSGTKSFEGVIKGEAIAVGDPGNTPAN